MESIEPTEPMEPATIANAQANPLPFCDAVGKTTGRKLRRQEQMLCRPRQFTEKEVEQINTIKEKDSNWMWERANDVPPHRIWQLRKSRDPECASSRQRPFALCCAGPPGVTVFQKKTGYTRRRHGELPGVYHRSAILRPIKNFRTTL